MMAAPHFQQLGRIKKKLVEVKRIDKDFLVFGASAHKYEMNPPITLSQVEAFETSYGIHLPDCYRAFILCIGNGGTSYKNSGAGPYYGIYTLGDHIDELACGDPFVFLKSVCCLFPEMTDLEWDNRTKILDEDTLSDEAYYKELAKIYGGILPLGFQGCTYVHGLILNGPNTGRIVNLELAADQKPFFAIGTNFLDWYECWLDEIISGKLITESPSWFGYPK